MIGDCLECYIQIFGFHDGRYHYLDIGIDSVVTFAHLVDSGVLKDAGAVSIEREFNCNADVDIYGDKLIPFLEKYYPKFDTSQIIPSDRYSIFCYDMS